MIAGSTRVYALIGSPVARSLSPALHNAWFRSIDYDGVYVALPVDPSKAESIVDCVRTLGLAGANLTVPFKSAAVHAVDHLTRAASEAMAVNTLAFRNGALVGHNTDGEGFCRAYEDEIGPLPHGPVLVIGAGGAGRAIAGALADRGVPEVILMNRTLASAELACEHLSSDFRRVIWHPAELHADVFARVAPSAELVVCCLSGDCGPIFDDFDLDRLRPGTVWSDVNYWQRDPAPLPRLRARGLRVQEGLGMLVHQAALSSELWTGVQADPGQMRAALG